MMDWGEAPGLWGEGGASELRVTRKFQTFYSPRTAPEQFRSASTHNERGTGSLALRPMLLAQKDPQRTKIEAPLQPRAKPSIIVP